MIEGGCFCGEIRYQIDDGDHIAANCHCSMCRRIHAAPFVSWLVVPETAFRYVAGSPSELASSTDGKRYFCAACGTHVACVNASHPGIVDVPLGTLDDPAPFPPRFSIHRESQLDWAFEDAPDYQGDHQQ